MATYVVFGKYTLEGLKGISAERTKQATALVQKHGGQIQAGWAMLGDPDLVFVVDFPSTEQAMQCSVAMSKLTNIAWITAPAVSIEEFDRLMAKA
jgi:uncharacterized protein with GYD domain